MINAMRSVNGTFEALGTTIFAVMSQLANEQGAINLGQGAPDDEGPEDLRRRAAEAVMKGPNQYPPMKGVPELLKAVAAHDNRFYGLGVDAGKEVMVTAGATEALAASLMALLEPGDEAILIEPAYDSYKPVIEAMGAKAVCVQLKAPEWKLDEEALARAFSDETKLLVFNSPMNPTGRVFTQSELEAIAALVRKHDAYVICDEVYEHLIYTGHTHVPLMTLPGMRERCVKIGSAGKTFSLTGWKIGYITACEKLMGVIAKAHQFITFTIPPAFQYAVAWGLEQDDAYYKVLAADLEKKRDLLTAGLAEAGFDVTPAEGTYFVTTDIRALGYKGTDFDFCRELTTETKVAAIPISAFYAPESENVPETLIRFCFCKQPAALEEAAKRLKRVGQKVA